jgi:nucleoid-associated protein YgaU
MLQKATIYWAAAFGAIAAAGAGGAIWHLRGAGAPASPPPVQAAAGATSPAAKREPAAVVAATGATRSASPSAPQKPSRAAPDAPRPQFDIVRIEASGEAVIAGHAAPKAKIIVTDDGRIVAEADADAEGQFVVLPPAFAPGAHALGLTARVGDAAPVDSPGVVGVDVPLPPQAATPPSPKVAAAPAPAPVRKLVTGAAPPPARASAPAAAIARADAARPITTRVAQTQTTISATMAASAPPPSAEPEVAPGPKPAEPLIVAKADAAAPVAATPRTAITGVAADAAGRMVTTGEAVPGALLRLYLNGSLLANVTAGAKGTWSLTVEHGMTGGAYAIRADEVDRAKGAVISRAEVPFNYPQQAAESGAAAALSVPAPLDSALTAASQRPKGAADATLASAQSPQAAPVATSGASPAAPVANASPPMGVASEPASTKSAPALASAAQPAAVAPNQAPAATPPAGVQPAAPAAPSPAASAALPGASSPTTAPIGPARAREEAAAASAPPEPAANAVVKLIDTHKVIPGDNLWDISQHIYGDGLRYTRIYAANANQIRNPRLIYPGQIFVLPQTTPF